MCFSSSARGRRIISSPSVPRKLCKGADLRRKEPGLAKLSSPRGPGVFYGNALLQLESTLVQINFFGSANLDSIREHQRARFANPVPETLTKRALFGRFSFEACAANFCREFRNSITPKTPNPNRRVHRGNNYFSTGV